MACRPRIKSIFACTIVVLLFAGAASARPSLQVGFLSGGNSDNEFWGKMARFAEAAADDLDIELIVKFSPQTTYTIKRQGLNLLKALDDNAYFITAYYQTVTPDLLKAAEKRGIRTFIINTAILDEDRDTVGIPREQYKHWIGHIHPDDVLAGYKVADEILSRFADAENAPKTIKIAGLSGDSAVQVSEDRDSGLTKRMQEAGNALLLDMKMARWETVSAKLATADFLERYPALDAVWASSDSMALGAIEAIKAAGKQPGKDVITAGVDWTAQGLAAVKSGEMTASVGGHFMEAAIALILIHDYHHGRDFADEPGVSFKTPMYPISQAGIDTYFEKVGPKPDWSKVDFKQFSKVHNTARGKYDFSWQRVLEQMNE